MSLVSTVAERLRFAALRGGNIIEQALSVIAMVAKAAKPAPKLVDRGRYGRLCESTASKQACTGPSLVVCGEILHNLTACSATLAASCGIRIRPRLSTRLFLQAAGATHSCFPRRDGGSPRSRE